MRDDEPKVCQPTEEDPCEDDPFDDELDDKPDMRDDCVPPPLLLPLPWLNRDINLPKPKRVPI